MPDRNTDPQRLAAFVTALTAIAEAALRGAEESTTCEDALDVIKAIGSACRVAECEFHGIAPPVWEPSAADVDDLVKHNAAVAGADYSTVPF